MFYLKVPLAEGVTVQASIRPTNVFTRCDCCGDEIPVDLSDVLSDGKSDLENTVLLCGECLQSIMERMRES